MFGTLLLFYPEDYTNMASALKGNLVWIISSKNSTAEIKSLKMYVKTKIKYGLYK